MTISTRNPEKLPDIPGLKRLTQSLAMLDAILSPEWEYRYYSFNGAWSEREMMASMRDGSGDQWFAIFSPDGAALHGLAHEAPAFRHGNPWPGIFDGLPVVFHANLLQEPAFTTADSTFCLWRLNDEDRWSHGPVEFRRERIRTAPLSCSAFLPGDPSNTSSSPATTTSGRSP